MLKRFIQLLFLGFFLCLLFLSWTKSGLVYGTLIRLWYTRPGAPAVEKLVERVESQPVSSVSYLRESAALYLAFPENRDVKLLYSRSLIRQGANLATALSILHNMANEYPADKDVLNELMNAMYEEGFYSDLVNFVETYKGSVDDPSIMKIYGISLYKVNKFEKSLVQLYSVMRISEKDIEAAYYTALCYEKLGDERPQKKNEYFKKSMFYIEMSKSYNGFKTSDYIRIMRKAGRSDAIDRFLRGEL